jgi:hypothetical protein
MRTVVRALLVLPLIAAVPADQLPLTRGIFVEQGVPCRGAPNVSIVSYWGNDNGINVSQVECRIKRMKRTGTSFTLDRACREIASGSPMDDQVKLTIANPKTLVMDGTTYRWCGTKVQF